MPSPSAFLNIDNNKDYNEEEQKMTNESSSYEEEALDKKQGS